MTPPPVAPFPITVPITPLRSTEKTKITLTSKMFQDKIYAPHGAQAFLATLPYPTQSETDISLTYLADLNIDYNTGIINCSDPRDFVTKT